MKNRIFSWPQIKSKFRRSSKTEVPQVTTAPPSKPLEEAKPKGRGKKGGCKC